MNRFAIFALLFFLVSCTKGVKKQEVEISLEKEFQNQELIKEQTSELKDWWESFNSPVLLKLINTAIAKNYSLKQAIQTHQEMRAMLRLQTAELFPQIDLNSEYLRQRFSQTLFESQFLGPAQQDFYNIDVNASWEIDLFGRLQKMRYSALYDLQASLDQVRGVYVTLLTDVAESYLKALYTKKSILTLTNLLKRAKEDRELTQDRYLSGIESGILFDQSNSIENEAKAALPIYETQLEQQLQQLVLLTALPKQEINDLIKTDQEIASPLAPKVLPSEILVRRPDIAEAEKRCASALALKQAKIRELFPRFTLMGSYGLESTEPGRFFSANSKTWSIGPSVTLPILYFGRIRAEINAQGAKYMGLFYKYQESILNAVTEVEWRLRSIYDGNKRLNAEKERWQSLKRISEYYNNRYEAGVDDFITFTQNDQTQLNALLDVYDAEREYLINLVYLYKAVGGDWECSPTL